MGPNQPRQRPTGIRCPYADLCEARLLSALAEGATLIIPLEDRRCRADDAEQHRRCATQLGFIRPPCALTEL